MARASSLGLRHRLEAIAASNNLDLRNPADRMAALDALGSDLRCSCSGRNLRRAARLSKRAAWYRATSALVERALRICTGGQRP